MYEAIIRNRSIYTLPLAPQLASNERKHDHTSLPEYAHAVDQRHRE